LNFGAVVAEVLVQFVVTIVLLLYMVRVVITPWQVLQLLLDANIQFVLADHGHVHNRTLA
jgi:hypothetical protein